MEGTTKLTVGETDVLSESAECENDRRDFLAKSLAAVGGAAAFMSAFSAGAVADIPRSDVASVLDEPETFAYGSNLERMRDDLARALKKPVEKRKWVMVIDLQKCIGCKSCTVSCVSENNLPPGVVYRPVMTEEVGTFPNVRKRFIPRPCMHCEDPPCVPPCPVGATFQRPDGIVAVNYDQCIGCRYCVTACPYGARSFDFGDFHEDGNPEIMDYEKRPNYEYGEEWVRDPAHRQRSPIGNARKCHFCLHRIVVGMLPACVTTCLGGATYFGDITDSKSFVSELIAAERVMRLKEELGTHPKVYYLT